MDPSLPSEDLRFAELVVAQGLCPRERVEECAALLARLIEGGVTPLPRLGELLARKGYLTPQQVDATLRPGSRAPAGRPGGAVAPELPADVAEAARQPANLLGKYVRVSRLGAGGMGEVWKGWDRELARWVALKFLKGDDPAELARFRREAQTAAALSHPNIASVYEVGESAGRPFIAMQYVRGGTLSEKDPRKLAELASDAALAVHYAHEKGVIHRDLKPANLMVESSRGDGKARIFVMDFGLAKPTAAASSLSISGAILGTPAYMPPEQAQGETERVGPASDVYSLGATLYELLAGGPPFQARDVYALLKKVVEQDPVPLRRRNAKVSPDLETVVLKCMEKDPSRRYATARELADDLRRWLAGEAILAHPPSTLYRFRKFLGRRKAVTALAAATLVSVALFVPVWLGERRDKELLKELAEMRTQMLVVKEWTRQAYRKPREIREALVREVAHVSEFIGRNPSLPQGYYVRAQGRLFLGDLARAEADLAEAVGREPSFGPGWTLLGRVRLEQYTWRTYGSYNLKVTARSAAARPLLDSAEEALARGAAEEGRKAIVEWDLSRTREEEVNENLIRALRARYVEEDTPKAVSILRQAQARLPSEEYCRELANWLQPAEEALTWADRGAEIAPHFARGRLDRGRIRGIRGDDAGSIEEFRATLEIDPGLAWAHANLGLSLWKRGDGDAGVASLTRAIALDPRHAWAYSVRADLRQRRGDIAGARQDCTRAIELDPDLAAGWAARGMLEVAAGDFDRALEDFDRAVELEPWSPWVLSCRAYGRCAKGDSLGALEDYTRAIGHDPRQARLYFDRASAHYQANNRKGALDDYTRGLEIEPLNREMLMRRARVWDELGDKEASLRDVRAALDGAPPNWEHRAKAEEDLRNYEKRKPK